MTSLRDVQHIYVALPGREREVRNGKLEGQAGAHRAAESPGDRQGEARPKREMMRLGLLTAGGSLIAKQGLSSRAFGKIALTDPDTTQQFCRRARRRSLGSQPMPTLTVKTPVSPQDMTGWAARRHHADRWRDQANQSPVLSYRCRYRGTAASTDPLRAAEVLRTVR